MGLSGELSWFTREEMPLLASLTPFSDYGIVGFVDGTRVRTVVSPSTFGFMNSGKIHETCFNIQVVTDTLGRFRQVVVGPPGTTHDSLIADQYLVSRREHLGLGQRYFLGGDLGYVGARNATCIFCPPQVASLPDLTPQDKVLYTALFDREWKRYRATIEHSIGILKRNWPFAGLPNRCIWTKRQHLLLPSFMCISLLQNRLWRLRESYCTQGVANTQLQLATNYVIRHS